MSRSSGSGRHTVLALVAVSIASVWLASCGPSGSSDKPTNPAVAAAAAATVPTVDVAKVISRKLSMTVQLPGELQPYEVVATYPKVAGFVRWIGVDRGSRVKAGEIIARLEAPELVAQRAEAQAKLQGAQSQLAAAEAKLSAEENTYQRLKAASATPGVVAGNDLLVAQKAAEADQAQVRAAKDGEDAAQQALQSIAEIAAYLEVRTPFDGVVTERDVHPGALVGPAGSPGGGVPMVRIETLARLRLVVPVPEDYVAGVPVGTKVEFAVRSFPGQTFNGAIARISHAVDEKTRTMPVELDVMNASGRLDPGTFSEVLWPVRRLSPTLFVPTTAVATNLTRTFVVRIANGTTEWVDVKMGVTTGNLIEVFGNLREGDGVAVRGTDELRSGTQVLAKLVSPG
ncbi:MAG TPA: efflux RND transporter periplasmic adaptor subunit [Terriglobia bacterium]|nr:efflux RND transporter periplasmic adaptor subunit [Terriglobia bacterium]